LKLPGLREQRELHGLSQSVLARAAGVSRDSISNYETGQREAWPSTAKKLADALGVDIADLTSQKVRASTPDEWARELGARLHGMSDQEWDAYVRGLDSVSEITQASKTLLEDERVMLHAALRADKWTRPGNREQRAELRRGTSEIRTRRLATLTAAAVLLKDEKGRKLGDEIHEKLVQEAHS
jgi:transcriptional regulator with XRE-family HTH domain